MTLHSCSSLYNVYLNVDILSRKALYTLNVRHKLWTEHAANNLRVVFPFLPLFFCSPWVPLLSLDRTFHNVYSYLAQIKQCYWTLWEAKKEDSFLFIHCDENEKNKHHAATVKCFFLFCLLFFLSFQTIIIRRHTFCFVYSRIEIQEGGRWSNREWALELANYTVFFPKFIFPYARPSL